MPHDAAEVLIMAEQLAAGDITIEITDWLARGFHAWLTAEGDLDLARCLALPPTSSKLRLARRDYWLTEAAVAMGGSIAPWTLAKRVYIACMRLQHGLPTPEHPAVALALRRAIAAGAPLPETVEGMLRVLRKKVDSLRH